MTSDVTNKAIVRFIEEIVEHRFNCATRDLAKSIAWDRPDFLPDDEFSSIDVKALEEARQQACEVFIGCVLVRISRCKQDAT
jgi:hypothetical protein